MTHYINLIRDDLPAFIMAFIMVAAFAFMACI